VICHLHPLLSTNDTLHGFCKTHCLVNVHLFELTSGYVVRTLATFSHTKPTYIRPTSIELREWRGYLSNIQDPMLYGKGTVGTIHSRCVLDRSHSKNTLANAFVTPSFPPEWQQTLTQMTAYTDDSYNRARTHATIQRNQRRLKIVDNRHNPCMDG